MPTFLKNGAANMMALCGVGEKTKRLSINIIVQYTGPGRCNELLFLHSFTGSDYTSGLENTSGEMHG